MGEARFDFGAARSNVGETTTALSVDCDVRKLAAPLGGANAAVGYPVPVGERSAV